MPVSGYLPTRRDWLLRGALGCLATVGSVWPDRASAHEGLGPVTPPSPAPALPVTLHDGRRSSLPTVLHGRITALQLMFTGCSAICPVQGAVFAELQSILKSASPKAQLLSLSIDPISDDAAALAAWRQRFGAGAAWLAAAPPVRHAQALPLFLGGPQRTSGAASGSGAARNGDLHSAQVYLFDTQARLAFRCAEFASPRSIAQAMQQLAARG